MRCFELRAYTVNPGKMDALHARFRGDMSRLFIKHGIEVVGYWVPDSAEDAKRTLIYLVVFPTKEARAARWKALVNDSEWKAVIVESERDGALAAKMEGTILQATDYSALR